MKKYLLFLFLIAVLGFSFTACDGGGESSSNGGELAGEQNCTDGIDNDGDTETDCEDIDCILDPACIGLTCEDFVNIFCNRVDECFAEFDLGQIFDECVMDISEIAEETMYCNDFEESSTAQECLDDYAEFDCGGVLLGAAPESCEQEGICEPCETDDDCALGQICGDFGIGGPFLCASEFFTTFCPIL